MAEESGPLVGDNFTDAQWRAIFGGEPGIVGDVDGSAYNLTLGAGTDDAQLGSVTQDSVAVVGGFMHRIVGGSTQAVTIPPSTNVVGRTDIIAVRLDAGTYTSAPGPCRLVRIAGVEGSSARPSMDEAPPGVEDFPLWAVTRKGNGTTAEGLNQAAKVDLRRRTGPNLTVPAGESLPVNVPVGTRARRGDAEFVREMVGSSAAWSEIDPVRTGTIAYHISGGSPAYGRYSSAYPANIRYVLQGGRVMLSGMLKRIASTTSIPNGSPFPITQPLPAEIRPTQITDGVVGTAAASFLSTFATTEIIFDNDDNRLYARHRRLVGQTGDLPITQNDWWVSVEGLGWVV
jgi:hypothetical protein